MNKKMDSDFKKARILVVDDQEANIEVVQTFLQMQGYENIATTTDPRTVFNMLEEFEPDIILLDLSMPYISGFDILKQLKTVVPENKYLPVLVLTADVTLESKRRALAEGASDFLAKPFDLVELHARVNTHLQIKYKNEQIKEYADKLEKLVATKDKFFSIIAHDVRNPFVGIENYIKIVLKLKKYSVDDIENDLQTIYSTANHGHELLENLLKWSRSQTGNIEINLESLQLRKIVNNAVNQVRTQTNNKNIMLLNEVPDDLSVDADQEMLETILRNLLSNAIKFTPDGGNVKVYASQLKDYVEISVSDTGIGISEEEKNKLFRIDSKLQSRRGTSGESGSGLGLILCKEFLDKLNGNIWVESKDGMGTTFKFSLPD